MMAPMFPLALAMVLMVPAFQDPGPLRLVEQASQEGFALERPFLDRGRQKLRAAGVYLRVRDGAKLYALCLYVDTKALAAHSKGQARTPEALAAALVEGKAAHAYVARIVEPFPRANRMAFLLGNLQRAWPDQNFDPGTPALKRFSAFFDRALAKGAETQVWIQTGGTLHTREAGGPSTATRDPVLATAFSGSYLGERCMDPALKADLLRELPAVLELEEMLSEKVGKGK